MRTASGDAQVLSSVPLPVTEPVVASSDGPQVQSQWADFEAFVREAEPTLSRALAAAYGFEDGRDAKCGAADRQTPTAAPAA